MCGAVFRAAESGLQIGSSLATGRCGRAGPAYAHTYVYRARGGRAGSGYLRTYVRAGIRNPYVHWQVGSRLAPSIADGRGRDTYIRKLCIGRSARVSRPSDSGGQGRIRGWGRKVSGDSPARGPDALRARRCLRPSGPDGRLGKCGQSWMTRPSTCGTTRRWS